MWDLLTFGPWVNRQSPGLPRASRLSVHLLSELEYYTGGGALQGFSRFGTSLLYVVLAGVVRERRQADTAAA